ncbi:MAG TPA: chloride channel protein [Ferruginibacter sp.]|nr:chloride channel protein [Ferruginibacter sp.]HMP20834.1 chloride channel protein [Ferruginibacter sp.]
MKWIKHLYQLLTQYLRTRFNRVQYIMFVAVFTGTVSGLVAVLLKTAVHHVQELIKKIPLDGFGYLLFPIAGLILTVWLVRLLFKTEIERGIAMVLKSVASRSSFIPLKHTYAHAVTSTVTVGAGGSVGLEAPIVATGSAIGSNIARISDFNYRERTLLIACGAAAGIAAVFNAPIAGVIFAIEVLLTETVVSYFIPLIISSVAGALCSKIILKESILFNFTLKQNFDPHNVPFYILLGVLAGFISLYYAYVFKSAERRIHQWKMNGYLKALCGGFALVAIYFLFAPLFGEGYEVIKLVADDKLHTSASNAVFKLFISNDAILIFALLILLLKPVAAAITIGSGGNGGNFAPSLFTGSFLGYFFSKMVNSTPWFKIPVTNFSLVGMAGVLSGVLYCPLTAVFLIAEITNGYELVIPLMIVSAISYFIVKHYEPYSMELKKLALEGQVFTHKKEQNILTTINLEDIIQKGYPVIRLDKKFKDLVEMLKLSEKNIFAVTDKKDRFIGIIELNDIKKLLFQPERFDKIQLLHLLKKPPGIIYEDDSMKTVMEKFDVSHSWYLPVLDKQKKFTGFVSKTKLFSKYREILASQGDLYDEDTNT